MKKALLTAALLAAPAMASAVVIDFETLASSGTGFVDIGNTYTEDGFTLTNLSSNYSSSFRSAEANNTQYYAGSAALFNNTGNGITELVSNSSSTFDLFSIDLTEIDVNRLGPTTVDFTGVLSGGATVLQSFQLDGTFGLETFLFSGFNNLVSVNWTQTFQYHQFDNITIDVAAVPEPGSIALLGLGLAGLGFSRRKSKA